MKELAPLQEKLKQLLTRFTALKEAAAKMERQIARQEEALQSLSQENDRLKEDLRQSHLGTQLSRLPEEQKRQLEEQIDTVLKMIEQNITLLK